MVCDAFNVSALHFTVLHVSSFVRPSSIILTSVSLSSYYLFFRVLWLGCCCGQNKICGLSLCVINNI